MFLTKIKHYILKSIGTQCVCTRRDDCERDETSANHELCGKFILLIYYISILTNIVLAIFKKKIEEKFKSITDTYII